MSSVARRFTAALFLASAITVACKDKDADVRASSDGRDRSDPTIAKRDTNRTLAPGDVRIMNADSSIELAVIGDSIVTGLGPKVIAEVAKNTDTSEVKGNGVAASIEKMVKSTVASAINHDLRYAVADVQRVQYVDGRIEFYWKDGSRMKLFQNAKRNDKPVSETFSEADAKQFIAAFDAKKAALKSKT
jgi:hypothetical protein